MKHRFNTGSERPVRQTARRLPPHKRGTKEKEIKRMLEADVIQPSSSPWASPIVLVTKKDGSTRFCVDYRRLNNITIKYYYRLPRIDDSLDGLSGSQWFSTLDMKSGYWQVEMDQYDKEKTAFITSSRLYEFNELPFGLCNAAASFERLTEKVLHGLLWRTCLLYLDDIIVYGKTFEEEVLRLEQVFIRMREVGLKLNPEQCCLIQRHVSYIGRLVSKDGISTDPEKIKAVKEWPTPMTVTQVRSFQGLCIYYRKFVKGFADIATEFRLMHNIV